MDGDNTSLGAQAAEQGLLLNSNAENWQRAYIDCLLDSAKRMSDQHGTFSSATAQNTEQLCRAAATNQVYPEIPHGQILYDPNGTIHGRKTFPPSGTLGDINETYRGMKGFAFPPNGTLGDINEAYRGMKGFER